MNRFLSQGYSGYTRLPAETESEAQSVASLGPWSRETTHLSASLDGIAFGVRHLNGISSPWTTGDEPARALADNPQLSGTATWTGGLVGFTPELRSVGGNAEFSVELASMDGRAEFTELQSWAAGSAPGALGTGETWNTRSLRYTITVDANYLRSTGGDAGTVNGQFYGTAHEGVAGSLERDDLTPAFAARGAITKPRHSVPDRSRRRPRRLRPGRAPPWRATPPPSRAIASCFHQGACAVEAAPAKSAASLGRDRDDTGVPARSGAPLTTPKRG